jgi:4-hydroxybenzoate polyprenyltransferase
VIRDLVAALRPRQWTKNLLLFAGVLFSRQADDAGLLLRAGVGFVAFSLLAGAVYLLNDLRDADQDRLHPSKRERPIARAACRSRRRGARRRRCSSRSARCRCGSGRPSRWPRVPTWR